MNAEDVQRDYIQIFADVTIDFVHGGVTYQGSVGPLVKTNNLVEGGLAEDYDLTISTSLKKLTQNDELEDRFSGGVLPVVGEKITYDSVSYRIERITTDQFAGLIQIDMTQT